MANGCQSKPADLHAVPLQPSAACTATTRCALPCAPGMKLANLSKILKCAGNDDAITMKSEDNGDTITFMFESQSALGWGAATHALS